MINVQINGNLRSRPTTIIPPPRPLRLCVGKKDKARISTPVSRDVYDLTKSRDRLTGRGVPPRCKGMKKLLAAAKRNIAGTASLHNSPLPFIIFKS